MSVCTSSLNRNDEWKKCCAETMGFEWVDCFDEDDNATSLESETEDILQVTNLLYDNDDDDDEYYHDDDDDFEEYDDGNQGRCRRVNCDAWTDNALRIQADLNRMAQWIQSKKQEYTGLDMKDEEAALIQSTVTSFAATTASELETLRNMIHSHSMDTNNVNLSNHRAGIVQILLAQLQERVTKPFGALQKQRVREAVKLWQNPLQCKLYEAPTLRRRTHDSLFDDDDDDENDRAGRSREQRFLPGQSYRSSTNSCGDGDSFISKYTNKPATSIPTNPPEFLTRLSRTHATEIDEMMPSPSSKEDDEFSDTGNWNTEPTTLPHGFQPGVQRTQNSEVTALHTNPELYHQQLEEDLQTESAQLTTTLIASNDLDNVQQMETRMVEITTLIGQFSNLVQDQQEQILQVHESARETKDNLDKGQENLIDAAERTRKSRHYKAWVILAMAGILAFFHILRN